MSFDRSWRASAFTLACATAHILTSSAASAQTPTEFYKGKTITITVGSGTGGGDDTFARIFAKYLPKHMAGNPLVIVQNMPGAGGVVAAGRMANSAPRDGTAIGTVMRGVPATPLLSATPVNFDSRKLNWLGSLSKETTVAVFWHTSPVKTFDDLLKRETIVGTTGGGSDTNVYALLFNQTLGTKFKIIGGYRGGPDIDIAMERGELEGRVSHTWTYLKGVKGEWLKEKQVRVPFQMGKGRHPELADVPNIIEFVKDPKVRAMYEFLFSRQEAARPYITAPDVPADRLAALRKALADVTVDREFVAEVEKIGGTVELMPGEEMQKMVEGFYDLPPEVINTVRAALNPK